MLEDAGKEGYCWVYVRNVGICRYNYQSKKLKVIHPLAMDVKCMKLAVDGNLWLGTDEGLYLFNAQSGSLSENYFATKCTVTSILLDKKKELWLTTDGCGIYKVNGVNEKAVPYNSARDNQIVKSNSVWSIYEDVLGTIWFGTLRGGISMIK